MINFDVKMFVLYVYVDISRSLLVLCIEKVNYELIDKKQKRDFVKCMQKVKNLLYQTGLVVRK